MKTYQPSTVDGLDVKEPIYVCTCAKPFSCTMGSIDNPHSSAGNAVLRHPDEVNWSSDNFWPIFESDNEDFIKRLRICYHDNDEYSNKQNHVHNYVPVDKLPSNIPTYFKRHVRSYLKERVDWTDPESVGRFEIKEGFVYPIYSDSPCPLTPDQLVIANTMEVAKKLGQPCDLKPTWEYYTNYDLQKILDLPQCGTYWAGFKATLSDLSKNLKWNREYGFSRIYNEEIFRKMFSPGNLKKLVTMRETPWVCFFINNLVKEYAMELMWLIRNGYILQDDESVKTMCDVCMEELKSALRPPSGCALATEGNNC
jgi:hypothetical protein